MDIPEHRNSLIALMMTGADLCATSKPWKTQAKTIQYLYEEFWMQVSNKICFCFLIHLHLELANGKPVLSV